MVRSQRLIAACSKSPDSDPHKTTSRHLTRLKSRLSKVQDSISPLEAENTCLLKQYEEQLSEFKGELGDVRTSLLSLDLEDEDEVFQLQAAVEKAIFNCSLNIKKLLHAHIHTSSSSDTKGVKASQARRSDI